MEKICGNCCYFYIGKDDYAGECKNNLNEVFVRNEKACNRFDEKPKYKKGKYIELAIEIGKLVQSKQQAYGDSFGRSGRVLKEMYPEGIKPDQYDDMLCVVRVIDKLFRIANKKDAFGESPYGDIVGYGLLGLAKDKKDD